MKKWLAARAAIRSLHADEFIVAQSDRTLVCRDPDEGGMVEHWLTEILGHDLRILGRQAGKTKLKISLRAYCSNCASRSQSF